jgi:hypothetical protein
MIWESVIYLNPATLLTLLRQTTEVSQKSCNLAGVTLRGAGCESPTPCPGNPMLQGAVISSDGKSTLPPESLAV